MDYSRKVIFSIFAIAVLGSATLAYAVTTFVDALDVSGETTEPFGLAFNSDGTVMLVADSANDEIDEYTCSTGFDISTCTDAGDELDIGAAIDATLTSLAFNSAGTVMLIVDSGGGAGDEIVEFTCSVGFDVSSCTTTGTDDFNINGELSTNTATGLAFNSAGTTMLLTDDDGTVYEYSCSVGFDVSSCTTNSDDEDISGTASSPTDLAFNSAGTKMFVTDDANGEVNEYTLSVGFDVSTATFVNVLDISTQELQPQGIAFSTNGLTMIISGDGGGGDISEFTLEVAFDLFSSPAITSSGASGGGSKDYMTKPTFGLDHRSFQPWVEGGFSFNGVSHDITDNYWTPFNEKQVRVGTLNTFSAKVYADKGLRTQEFLFGIPEVGKAQDAEVSVEVWYDHQKNIIDVKLNQKTNVVDADSLTIAHSMTDCSSENNLQCDLTEISMKFLEPLNDKVMAINAVDHKNRSQLTYQNEGFDIAGDSLNPMLTLMIPSPEKYEGLIEVMQIAKYSDIWISKDGREFVMDKSGGFTQINESFVRHDDTGIMKNRLHSGFADYKDAQADDAIEQLLEICPTCLTFFVDFDDSFAYDFPISYEKYNDPTTQATLITEDLKAKQTLDRLFEEWYPGMTFD